MKGGAKMDDAAIIGLYWARSERAIERTQEKDGARCRAAAWNILRSHADSEECVNDTCLCAVLAGALALASAAPRPRRTPCR